MTIQNPDLLLPAASVLPDFGEGGIFGLASSFAGFLDGLPWRFGSDGGDREADDPHVVVFLLLDGLGDCFLQQCGAGSALLDDRVRRLTSVFPSTTASAVTTMLTALAPCTHGLNGWFVRDRRFGGVVAPLPLTERGGRRLAVDRTMLKAFFPYPNLFDQRRRRSVALLPAYIADSPFSRRHCRGAQILPHMDLEHMFDSIRAASRALHRKGGGFIHAYFADFDALSHEFGCQSAEATAVFWQIDSAYRRLLNDLAGENVTVVISADHGFVDSPPERFIRLDAWPEVFDMLDGCLWGERRAAFCEVRVGSEASFIAWAQAQLKGAARVVESRELLAAGLLGRGPNHRLLLERVGSHTLLMEPGWTIWDPRQGEEVHRMLGVHGGLSADEMWVPLIVRDCAR